MTYNFNTVDIGERWSGENPVSSSENRKQNMLYAYHRIWFSHKNKWRTDLHFIMEEPKNNRAHETSQPQETTWCTIPFVRAIPHFRTLAPQPRCCFKDCTMPTVLSVRKIWVCYNIVVCMCGEGQEGGGAEKACRKELETKDTCRWVISGHFESSQKGLGDSSNG